jgi:outer membrane protein OmpA-like peptidoglycan-associated protein/plastocyanin
MGNRHVTGTAIAALLAFLSVHARAQIQPQSVIPVAPFDDRPYVSFWGSYDIADPARGTAHGFGGGLSVGKAFSKGLELELLGSYLHFGADKGSGSSGSGLSSLLGGTQSSSGSGAQNIAVGGAGANIYLLDEGATSLQGFYIHGDGTYGKAAAFDLGAGYSIPLASLGPLSDMSLRLEALYHKQGHYDEPVFNIGLKIPIGPRPVAPAPPPPPPPPPPPEATITPVPTPAPMPCEESGDQREVTLSGCKRGDVIVLRGVNFDYDKASLTLNAKALLDQVAHALSSRPDIMAELDGHTDGIGGVAYNQRLSERRAASVKNYLVMQGIAANRLTTRGFGKSMPIADNATAEGRELNRRVELKVVDSAAPDGMSGMAMPSAPGPSGLTAPLMPAADTATSNANAAIGGYAFSPPRIVIARGGTVTWTNNDPMAHTVTFNDTDSGPVRHGASYSRTFDKSGEYAYHCSIHPGMSGTVVVQ